VVWGIMCGGPAPRPRVEGCVQDVLGDLGGGDPEKKRGGLGSPAGGGVDWTTEGAAAAFIGQRGKMRNPRRERKSGGRVLFPGR